MRTLDQSFPLAASLPEEISSEDELPVDREFVIQAKWDGMRILVDYRGDSPKILNRHGETFGARPFKVDIPVHLQGMVVDGEYIPACNGFPDQYIIFDCLWGDDTGRDPSRLSDHPLYRKPFNVRMRYIHRALGKFYSLEENNLGIAKGIRWFTSTKGTANLDALRQWDFPRLDQVDGIVYKDPKTPYVPGRRGGWFKYKFTASIDAFVVDLNVGGKSSNAALAIYDPLTKTNFDIARASTAGHNIHVGDVVEVKFLKFTGSRLREPRIIRVREDKTAAECGVGQLVPHCRALQEENV